MKIRLATEADLPVLRKLTKAAQDDLDHMDEAIYLAMEYGVKTGQAVVVAEQHDESTDRWDTIGWCARVWAPGLPPDRADGIGVWVHKPYRRERVASDLKEFADAYTKDLGRKEVTGTVLAENEAGLRSALKSGFKVVGYMIRKDL